MLSLDLKHFYVCLNRIGIALSSLAFSNLDRVGFDFVQTKVHVDVKDEKLRPTNKADFLFLDQFRN